MNNVSSHWRKTASLTLLTLMIGLSPHADARSRTVQPYNNGGGNVGRTVTQTRPDGQTETGSASRTVSNGTVTDSRSGTGYYGNTASSTLTRTPGQGATYNATGPNGGTSAASYSH